MDATAEKHSQQEQPLLSVVITTHNRVAGVAAAIDSVMSAHVTDSLEVVVVDDGSDDSVAAALDELSDDVVTVVHQDNLGLGGARVTGASRSRGSWLAFLDDDDRWLPAWSEMFALIGTDDVGIVSGGARFVSSDGAVIGQEPPRPLGPIFHDITAQYLAGCFAVRRDVYESAGGYLPGLSSAHQTELFIRCSEVCAAQGLRVLHSDKLSP